MGDGDVDSERYLAHYYLYKMSDWFWLKHDDNTVDGTLTVEFVLGTKPKRSLMRYTTKYDLLVDDRYTVQVWLVDLGNCPVGAEHEEDYEQWEPFVYRDFRAMVLNEQDARLGRIRKVLQAFVREYERVQAGAANDQAPAADGQAGAADDQAPAADGAGNLRPCAFSDVDGVVNDSRDYAAPAGSAARGGRARASSVARVGARAARVGALAVAAGAGANPAVAAGAGAGENPLYAHSEPLRKVKRVCREVALLGFGLVRQLNAKRAATNEEIDAALERLSSAVRLANKHRRPAGGCVDLTRGD